MELCNSSAVCSPNNQRPLISMPRVPANVLSLMMSTMSLRLTMYILSAVQLIKVRAEAMQAASELVPGGMVTTFYGHKCRLGLCCDTAKEFCISRGVVVPECRVASYLGPSCKVVGGSEEVSLGGV